MLYICGFTLRCFRAYECLIPPPGKGLLVNWLCGICCYKCEISYIYVVPYQILKNFISQVQTFVTGELRVVQYTSFYNSLVNILFYCCMLAAYIV